MAEANWYVVHTYSGYENKVKANIEKTIENRHLEDEILEVRVPMLSPECCKESAFQEQTVLRFCTGLKFPSSKSVLWSF